MTNEENQICAICGENPAESTDHIPPKSIFKKPRPNNLLTVPSCTDCNEGASKDDEYFLHFLTTSISPEEHQDIGHLLKNSTMASLKREEAKRYREYFFNSFDYEDVYDVHGHLIDEVPIRMVEAGRILDVIKRIGKGLYYIKRDKPVPDNANLEAMMMRPGNFLNDLQDSKEFFKPTKIGNKAFEYSAIIPHDCDVSAAFYLKFYQTIPFFINVEKLA